jgi:hypothetical protein
LLVSVVVLPSLPEWYHCRREFHFALPRFHAVVVQAIRTRCRSVAASSKVDASGHLKAPELFSLPGHLRLPGIRREAPIN